MLPPRAFDKAKAVLSPIPIP